MTEAPTTSGPQPRSRWRSPASLVSLLISGTLLVALYRTINMTAVAHALEAAHPAWLLFSISIIAPITVVRALRFQRIAPPNALPGAGEAIRLSLVASTLNAFMPGKSGDLIKSYFVATRGGTTAGVGLAVVVYERLSDMFGLLLWCVLAFLIAPPIAADVPPAVWPLLGAFGLLCGVLVSSETAAGLLHSVVGVVLPGRRLRKLRDLARGWPDLLRALRGRRVSVLLVSCGLWLIHLVQMWLFTIALSTHVPFTVCASLSALALMAGQVPFTVAGVGARDVALVALLSGYMTAEEAAAMGLLVSTRNILPLLAGLPYVRRYLAVVVKEAQRWRRDAEARERDASAPAGSDQRARP